MWRRRCDGGTSASGDNFGFCQCLKSNLLGAVVFSPWRISRHFSREKCLFFGVDGNFCGTGEMDMGEDFLRARASSKQVEMSGNNQTVRQENWFLYNGRLDILFTT